VDGGVDGKLATIAGVVGILNAANDECAMLKSAVGIPEACAKIVADRQGLRRLVMETLTKVLQDAVPTAENIDLRVSLCVCD
jgi:hypothetical protein